MKERVPPRHIGIIAMSKGPYLDPISVVMIEKSQISIAKRTKEQTGTRPLKIGHGPLAVIYPESLLPKLKCARRKE
jgi:hypothetical protein